MSEGVERFLLVDQYSLVLLIASDRFIGQFGMDREMIAFARTELDRYYPQDEPLDTAERGAHEGKAAEGD